MSRVCNFIIRCSTYYMIQSSANKDFTNGKLKPIKCEFNQFFSHLGADASINITLYFIHNSTSVAFIPNEINSKCINLTCLFVSLVVSTSNSNLPNKTINVRNCFSTELQQTSKLPLISFKYDSKSILQCSFHVVLRAGSSGRDNGII